MTTARHEGSARPPEPRRRRGRPRMSIVEGDVADAVKELIEEGGFDAVSIASAAEKLRVSRATLYRTIPSKEHLLGVAFEAYTRDLLISAEHVVDDTHDDPRGRLFALVQLQVQTAIDMRHYMPIFYHSSGLPGDVHARWRVSRLHYEDIWEEAVVDAMAAGAIQQANPRVAMRLLFGMCLWVSRWHRPGTDFDREQIIDGALQLLEGPSAFDEAQTG